MVTNSDWVREGVEVSEEKELTAVTECQDPRNRRRGPNVALLEPPHQPRLSTYSLLLAERRGVYLQRLLSLLCYLMLIFIAEK